MHITDSYDSVIFEAGLKAALMNINTILKFVVLISIFFIMSCRKDTEKLTFKVGMNITSLYLPKLVNQSGLQDR